MTTAISAGVAAAIMASGIALATGSAHAVTQTRNFVTNPVGICQAALPAFEGQIRKRPLAVQNEGTATAFITCSFTSQTVPSSAVIYFASSDGAPHSISCTGVSGYNTGPNQFIAKTVDIPASGQVSLQWQGADFTGAPATFPSSRFSVQCAVAPGVGVNDTVLSFSEDVGA